MLDECVESFWRGNASIPFVNPKPYQMISVHKVRILTLLCVCVVWPAHEAHTQVSARPPRGPAAPATNVTVDGSEAMFTTMCALHAAGFEEEVSATGWHPLRARLREILLKQEGPAVEALRRFYHEHEVADPGTTLSRYVWYGMVAGPAPRFKPIVRREELPPDVLALEGFDEILANYYHEQKIGLLWQQVQPAYQKEIERLHEPISQIVYVASGYLREMQDATKPQTFTIIVEPMVGRITNVRNFGEHYTIVLSGSEQIPLDVVRHAYLHFLLDALPLRYSHVAAAKRPLLDYGARAPRLPAEFKDDFSSFFAECLVRAVELKLKGASPGEREARLQMDDENGYVLVRPLYSALTGFEQSPPSMSLYFPDLVRSIDTTAETKRLDSVKFAAADPAPSAADSAMAEVTRIRKSLPTTVPNDAEAMAALTEGEKQVAAKNSRAAEAAFRKVLEKYPDQARAWYGIGLVAMLNQDGPRAKQIFGRLVAGEHAAAGDPMVLAWSHFYLGRVYEIDGQVELAKQEYQAALDVPDAPAQARLTAQQHLEESRREKPATRP